MEEIKVPKYVLKSIENTLRRWANINNSYLKSSCIDRDTIGNLVQINKLLNGKELTGMERLEIIENKFNFNSIYQIWDNCKVFFVFSDDGSISCRLSFYDDTPQNAIVSDLYVHENMRKQGGATAILNWCFECAKERGCNSVSLRSDNDDWVREWYKRIGFKIESTSIWLTKNI